MKPMKAERDSVSKHKGEAQTFALYRKAAKQGDSDAKANLIQ